MPQVFLPLVCAVEAMTLSCWLLDLSLTRRNGVYRWAKGGLSMVLGLWCSFLDGLEVSLLFLDCSLSGGVFFPIGCMSAEDFRSLFSGLYFRL